MSQNLVAPKEEVPTDSNNSRDYSSSAANPQPPQTNAVNRGITDLHLPTWFALIAGSAFCRTTLQHPLNVAISRKRISDGESPSLKKVFMDALRGKNTDAVGAAGASTKKSKASNSGSSASHSQSHPPNSSNALHPVAGTRNLYRGFGAAATGNVVGEIIYLVTVESMRHTLKGDWYAKTDEGADEETHLKNSVVESSSNSTIVSQVSVDAAAGMIGDVAAMLVCTPLSVAVNKQTTAGYGLNRLALYRSLPDTLREMWHAHPRPDLSQQAVGTVHNMASPLDLSTSAGSSSSSSGAASRVAASASGATSSTALMECKFNKVVNNSLTSSAQAMTLRQRLHRRRVTLACGLQGWYAGLSASLVMLPASGLWWGSYGQLKRLVYGIASPHLEKMNNSRDLGACSELNDHPRHSPGHPSKVLTAEDLRETLSMGHLPLNDHAHTSTHHHPSHERHQHPLTSTSAALTTTAPHQSPSSSDGNASANSVCALGSERLTSSPVPHQPVPWYLSPTDNPILNGLAGVLATLITTVLYNPVSVIRTRLQALPPPVSIPKVPITVEAVARDRQRVFSLKRVASTLQARRAAISNSRILTLSRELVQREGYRGFFKGTITNASVSVIDGLLFATLFELTKFGSDISIPTESV